MDKTTIISITPWPPLPDGDGPTKTVPKVNFDTKNIVISSLTQLFKVVVLTYYRKPKLTLFQTKNARNGSCPRARKLKFKINKCVPDTNKEELTLVGYAIEDIN